MAVRESGRPTREQRFGMKRNVSTFRNYAEVLTSGWRQPIVTVGLAALAAGLIVVFWRVARLQKFYSCMPEFIGLLLLAGILYIIGVFLVDRFRLGATALIIILASAVLFRVVLLRSPLTPSGDVYRYQWDGRVQRAHLNPYVVEPNTPGLESLKNPEHPEPPGEDTPTIYPPVAEIVYRLIETAPGYKRVSTLLDLASAALLLLLLHVMKRPLHHVLVYAWNPTVLVAFPMSGHFDSLAIATLLAALFFLVTNRQALSIATLALSFLSKFFPLLLLVTFMKRVRLAYLAVFGLVVFAFYLPFLGAGWHLFEGAMNYAQGWLNNASLFQVLLFVARSTFCAELLAGLIVVGLIVYLAKTQAAPLWSSLILTAGVLLVSPTAYPWYLTWSIPFLCFYPSAAWLLMTVTSILAYAPAIALGADQPLKHSLLMLSLEYGPVYLWLGYYVWARSASCPFGPRQVGLSSSAPR
jgi:alpha-1,6-mannosyltransferase